MVGAASPAGASLRSSPASFTTLPAAFAIRDHRQHHGLEATERQICH
jgi:hypothetical protein